MGETTSRPHPEVARGRLAQLLLRIAGMLLLAMGVTFLQSALRRLLGGSEVVQDRLCRVLSQSRSPYRSRPGFLQSVPCLLTRTPYSFM